MSAPVIAVFTSTRADWGLLKAFCAALQDKGAEVRIIATGTHLSRTFGETWREIQHDGFAIDERIPILVDSDDALGESKTMALALAGTATYLVRKRPNAVLLLGDRYEMLGIAEAAFLARVPIVHVHGGEVTEGAIDDAVRHCITKLASLHLVSTEEYRRRVIQLGENPATVFNVGAVGVENVRSMRLLPKDELLRELGISGINHYAMMTYHPETLGDGDYASELDIVLAATLEEGFDVIATKANADAGGRVINARLDEWASKNDRVHVYASLGSLRYLSAVKSAQVVVGNSSSGILEAPALGTPVINIGNRQRGRIRPVGVLDVELDSAQIRSALSKVTSDEWKRAMVEAQNPYGDGHTSKRSSEIILHALAEGFPQAKKFFDVVYDDSYGE